MLQAMNEQQELQSLIHLTHAEINHLKKTKLFYCPDCKETVFIRHGKRTTPHFVHYHTTNCKRSGESPYHERAKLQLYTWLKKQFTDVTLEKYLPSIQQYPDIYVKTDKHQIACEFQSSKIPLKVIQDRNKGYIEADIQPLWFIGANQLKRRNKDSFYMNTFLKQFIYEFQPNFPPSIYFYCPQQQEIIIWSHIYPLQKFAYGKQTIYSIQSVNFPSLFSTQTLSIPSGKIYSLWKSEKQKFRLHPRSLAFGAELTWRQWLYEKGYHVEQLPALVHLPIPRQYMARVPLWNWQSRIIIDFFEPLALDKPFTQTSLVQQFQDYFYPESMFPFAKWRYHPIEEFISYWVQLKYIKQVSKGVYVKIKQLSFANHIEEAVKADKEILTALKEVQKIAILDEN